LEGSYVPPVAIRVLRDLTRYRIKLVQYQSSIANRIQKLLEQCNIKLASVASDALGVSAMAMLRALAQGETDPVRMAGMAKKQLRKKIPQLQLALEGCVFAASSFAAARNDRGLRPCGNQEPSRTDLDRAGSQNICCCRTGICAQRFVAKIAVNYF
jgi:hypothetical protein